MDNNKRTGLRSGSDIDIRVSPRQTIRCTRELNRLATVLCVTSGIGLRLKAELNYLQPPNFKTETRPYWRRFEKKHTKN